MLGGRRVCIQMDDSEWTNSFSLSNSEINQSLEVEHPKGMFEVGFKIKNAPGRLGKYTKLVRFTPKFTIVNKLPYGITLGQPKGFAGVYVLSCERVCVRAFVRLCGGSVLF